MMNVAVIGCGRWGPNHIRIFSSLPGSRVVAAVDRDQNRLASVSQAFPELPVGEDYREFF